MVILELGYEFGKLMCVICMNKKLHGNSLPDIINDKTYDRYEMETHLESEHTIKEVITTLREQHWSMMKH